MAPSFLPNRDRVMWTVKSLPSDGPRYLAIVDRIQRDIASGALRPGVQLPPQRDLAERLGVDLTTISRAYAEATRRGLVAGHVGRGTFVRSLPQTGTDATVDLSLNLPPAPVLEDAERTLGDTLRSLVDTEGFHGLLEYQPNAGRADHRDAGATWIGARGVEVGADRIIVTAGAQHALTVLLTTYMPADGTVMAEALTYPVFKALAEQLRLKVRGLPMDADGLEVEPFRRACRSGLRLLYCTPTLQNPTAGLMSLARRRAIADVANEFGVTVIEDDTYGMLPRQAPAALSSLVPETSFLISSMSKSVAPGLRIAYVAAPSDRMARQVASGVRATSWMATPLTAEIAARWIRGGTAARLVAANQVEANVRQRIAAVALAGHDWHSHPESYHGWLGLPESWSTAEFVMQARRQKVLVSPGDAFAVDREKSSRGVRLSLSAPAATALLESALGRLSSLLETGPDMESTLL